MKRKSGTGGRKRLAVCLLSAVCTFTLTACGSQSYTKEAVATAEEYALDSAAEYDSGLYEGAAAGGVVPEESPVEESPAKNMAEVQKDSRKLIKTVNLSVETKDFNGLFSHLEKQVETLDGYIESLNTSESAGSGSRTGYITARIPVEKLDLFVTYVSENANIISRNESVEDVTLQYVDLESHKKSLLAEQESLMRLLENAESMEEIIALQERLSQVRYEIESIESSLRTLKNLIAYSTVNIDVREVTTISAAKEQTAWEQISTGFMNNVIHIRDAMLNFGIGFIIALPILLVISAIILFFVLLIRFLVKRHDKKTLRKKVEREGAQSGIRRDVAPKTERQEMMQKQEKTEEK